VPPASDGLALEDHVIDPLAGEHRAGRQAGLASTDHERIG
jgi:hypothetical protein